MKEIYRDEETMYAILLDEASQKYFIEVTCGTIGWYDVVVELMLDEVEAFNKDPQSLRRLRREIFDNPEKFKVGRPK
jgi:hypothetical protein